MSSNKLKAKKVQLIIKRIIDISAAIIALTMGLPLFILISIYIMISDGSPFLFKQERAGYKGKPFICYKFRTMTNDRGPNGELLADEYRLKSWGKLLRNTSLDELPQFVNVLKGDMSLIGPRPLPVIYLPRYTSEQTRRHEVYPGITGWTGVNGRNNIDWDEKFRMDIWYVENWSLILDFKILILTIYKVLLRDGTHRNGHATRDDFKGYAQPVTDDK